MAARWTATTSSCPPDPGELLSHVRPTDQQWFIEEVTQALAVAAETKDLDRCRMCSKPGP